MRSNGSSDGVGTVIIIISVDGLWLSVDFPLRRPATKRLIVWSKPKNEAVTSSPDGDTPRPPPAGICSGRERAPSTKLIFRYWLGEKMINFPQCIDCKSKSVSSAHFFQFCPYSAILRRTSLKNRIFLLDWQKVFYLESFKRQSFLKCIVKVSNPQVN